jgi:hypothetical protein
MKRKAVLGAVLAVALAATVTAPAQAAVSTQVVPFRMDASNQAGWWKPIEEFGGLPYVAYNAWGSASEGGSTDTHTVYVARREPNGTWTRGCMQTATGACAVFNDDVGHYQPSISIDGDGYLHAFVSMHNNDWRYYRSTAPGDVTTMVNRSTQLPDQGGQYTYPNVSRAANGDLYLIVRSYPQGRLYRWNNAANTWSRVAIFAAATNYVVYPDDVIGDSVGNIHIAWEWAYGGANGLRHLASYLRYEPATNRFFTASGAQIAVPVTTTSPVVYQPLEGQELSTDRDNASGPPGVQSAKLAINLATMRPVAAYRYRSAHGYPWRVRLAEWTGTAWRRQVVYGGAYDTTAAVDVSVHNSGIRVYYAKAATLTGDQAFAATRQPDGTWAETVLLPGVRVERLGVIRRGATDHLYLAAPSAHELYYGTSTW